MGTFKEARGLEGVGGVWVEESCWSNTTCTTFMLVVVKGA